MNIEFTCIIPSTGRESLRELALPSALNQSYPFIEVIVVFDLPEDSDLRAQYSDVKVIFTGGNRGGPAARMMAFDLSCGDYVVLLDDDDRLDLDFVKSLALLLEGNNDEPSLIVPTVKKIWPEGCLPNFPAAPPASRKSSSGRVDLNAKNWLPSTSSGLVLGKKVFGEYPASAEIQGFNDVQIVSTAKLLDAPVYYNPKSIVYFYQYFSINRLTSDLSSRTRNLDAACEHGLEFTPLEKENILLSTAFSQARSIAYRKGFFSALSDLNQNLALLGNSWMILLRRKAILNFGVILWISIAGRVGR